MTKGILKDIDGQLSEGLAHYQILLNEQPVQINALIGGPVRLQFSGKRYCLGHGEEVAKLHSGGYCGRCFKSLPQCDLCILRPSLCHYHRGTCRDAAWGERHCMIPHTVYLANSGGPKVGITRQRRLTSRWVEQGAIQGLPIAHVNSRYQSGCLEELIATHVADKTDWRTMLKGQTRKADLAGLRDNLMQVCGEELDSLEEQFGAGEVEFLEDASAVAIEHPVARYPDKITPLDFDKEGCLGGELWGAQGTWLIFDSGVCNLRRLLGLELTLHRE